MIASNKCLVDNWSLEQAVSLLNNDVNYFMSDSDDLFSRFGGLSNFINGILLYEETTFIENGNQSAWQRFSDFHGKVSPFLVPVKPIENNERYYSFFSSDDFGARYYLMMSKFLNAELFISANRANKVLQRGLPKIDSDFVQIMNAIDKRIENELENVWIDKVKLGIKDNFILPSLTQYVLKQASSRDDFLDVVLQLKGSNEIIGLKEKISELCLNIKDYTKFQNEVDRLLKKQFNIEVKPNNTLSVNIKVLFLSLTKSFDLDFLKHKSYLTYLKDIIACRTETFGMKNHLERVFEVDFDRLQVKKGSTQQGIAKSGA